MTAADPPGPDSTATVGGWGDWEGPRPGRHGVEFAASAGAADRVGTQLERCAGPDSDWTAAIPWRGHGWNDPVVTSAGVHLKHRPCWRRRVKSAYIRVLDTPSTKVD